MTQKRLRDAIEEHDPDGQGVERVKRAARREEMIPNSACACLLAVAWSNDTCKVIVYDEEFYQVVPLRFPCPGTPHQSRELVVWFDELVPNPDCTPKERRTFANATVWQILEEPNPTVTNLEAVHG